MELGKTMPYEVRSKIFGFLDLASIKEVRLVCKDWMFQLENDGLLNPVFDDRDVHNMVFCDAIKTPKGGITILHASELDSHFISWAQQVSRLSVNFSLKQFNYFTALTKNLTILELTEGFFSDHKLNWQNSKGMYLQVHLPVLKILKMKISLPVYNAGKVKKLKVKKSLVKFLTSDLKEIIIMSNIENLLKSIKTPALEHFQFCNDICSDNTTFLKDNSSSDDDLEMGNVNKKDKQWDVKEFVCKNLKHLKILDLSFPGPVAVDKLYLSPVTKLVKLSYKLYDGNSRFTTKKTPLSEYFWNQFMERCQLSQLRVLKFESSHVLVSLVKLMAQLTQNVTFLEHFEFSGILVTEIISSESEIKRYAKNVRVSCSIFQEMINLKKLCLKFTNSKSYVQLLQMDALPSGLEHLKVIDALVMEHELLHLKRLNHLKVFAYNNGVVRSFNSKAKRMTSEGILCLLLLRHLEEFTLSPIFTKNVVGFGDDEKFKGYSFPKRFIFGGKEKTDIMIHLQNFMEIRKIDIKKGYNAYFIQLKS